MADDPNTEVSPAEQVYVLKPGRKHSAVVRGEAHVFIGGTANDRLPLSVEQYQAFQDKFYPAGSEPTGEEVEEAADAIEAAVQETEGERETIKANAETATTGVTQPTQPTQPAATPTVATVATAPTAPAAAAAPTADAPKTAANNQQTANATAGAAPAAAPKAD